MPDNITDTYQQNCTKSLLAVRSTTFTIYNVLTRRTYFSCPTSFQPYVPETKTKHIRKTKFRYLVDNK